MANATHTVTLADGSVHSADTLSAACKIVSNAAGKDQYGFSVWRQGDDVRFNDKGETVILHPDTLAVIATIAGGPGVY